MTKRRVVVGGIALVLLVVLYHVVCLILPSESLARLVVSDLGFVTVQVIVLALCVLALVCNGGRQDRWVWAWMTAWMSVNLFADSVWAYYEVFLRIDPPSPGLADVGYLTSYLVGFAGVLFATWKSFGFLRSLETTLDAMMFTIGIAALSWPLLLGPLVAGSAGIDYWVTLAYAIGDLFIILAFVSFFLASSGSNRGRPRPYFLVICLAFVVQIIADGGYFVTVVAGWEYGPGSWMDAIWLLGFAAVGLAAFMGIREGRAIEAETPETAGDARSATAEDRASGSWRMAVPYAGIPIMAGSLVVQFQVNGWRWVPETQILVYLGLALVLLVVWRQYLILLQNRRLNTSLSQTSAELEERVSDLAGLSEHLELLNRRAHRLNSLQSLSEVADAGLELACLFERSPGGWISMKKESGEESVVAVRGALGEGHPDYSDINALEMRLGSFRAASLEVRGEIVGTMYLLEPGRSGDEPDLLPLITAHVATAIDNSQRYQDALNLAERDALTGLFNHRGIHKRLAGEALRAQQSGSELSLIMVDIDDFKLLNDTYGHPVGDSVLRQVSDGIRTVLRHADLAGRVGGDELLLVLPNTGAEGALQLSERVRTTLLTRPYVTNGGHAIPVRVSLGVATYPADAQSLGQLIETADGNLYASKQRGGNTTTGCPAEQESKLDAGGLLGVAGRLLNVVGARDHYTRRHSEQVVLYALSLGEAVGLSEDALDTLHIAAMLHDVGKIGVPSHLLHKPSPLSPAEEDMVRRHVDISATIINDIPRLAEVAEAVRAHHERHDGSGYPDESAGGDIPLLGRILAVADAYSAMTLDRPYRKTLTHQQARTELEQAAGTQLDPELVRKFLEILDRRDILSAADACAEAS